MNLKLRWMNDELEWIIDNRKAPLALQYLNPGNSRKFTYCKLKWVFNKWQARDKNLEAKGVLSAG